MKKRILVFLLFIIIIVISIGYIIMNSNGIFKVANEGNYEIIKENLKIIPINKEIIEKQVVEEAIASASMLYDISNNELIAEKAEAIIIGTVSSIEGMVNYNPTTGHYVMARTVGTINVEKVLKGNINDKEISFIRLGGTIPLSEYEKSLFEPQIEKRGLNKMTQEEKESKYITEKMEGDISIEENKTYLMYLNYSEDYKRYSISFMQYGLREIEEQTLNISTNSMTVNNSEYNTIKVKDNKYGGYETLDSIIPSNLKK